MYAWVDLNIVPQDQEFFSFWPVSQRRLSGALLILFIDVWAPTFLTCSFTWFMCTKLLIAIMVCFLWPLFSAFHWVSLESLFHTVFWEGAYSIYCSQIMTYLYHYCVTLEMRCFLFLHIFCVSPHWYLWICYNNSGLFIEQVLLEDTVFVVVNV